MKFYIYCLLSFKLKALKASTVLYEAATFSKKVIFVVISAYTVSDRFIKPGAQGFK